MIHWETIWHNSWIYALMGLTLIITPRGRKEGKCVPRKKTNFWKCLTFIVARRPSYNVWTAAGASSMSQPLLRFLWIWVPLILPHFLISFDSIIALKLSCRFCHNIWNSPTDMILITFNPISPGEWGGRSAPVVFIQGKKHLFKRLYLAT